MSRYFVLIRIVLLLIIPALLAYAVFRFLLGALLDPVDPANKTQIAIEITPGSTFRGACRLLEEKGLVKYARSLDLLARLKGSPTDKISAGEYILSPSMEPAEILAKLVAGDVVKREVKLIEGMTVSDLARIVGESQLISEAEMTAALKDTTLLLKAGISSETFEGYLHPDTYIFSRPVTAQQIIWRMLEEGEKRWPAEYSEQADRLGLSRHEILTLASIIEKESSQKKEEQPLISSVFQNRLRAGMKLQSDPTVIYGLPNFNGNLTKDDLQNPHNYNTYVHFGLPPGPIAAPGAGAVKAALFPADSNYLFFVADGSGGHVFSTTLSEHNEAVARLIAATADAQ